MESKEELQRIVSACSRLRRVGVLVLERLADAAAQQGPAADFVLVRAGEVVRAVGEIAALEEEAEKMLPGAR